jgi:hypothetical protein
MNTCKRITLSSFLINFFLLLTFLAIPDLAVSEDKFFDLSMPTEFIPAMAENGSPQYITAEQIEKDLKHHSKEFQRLYWNKTIKHFILPRHEWLEELLAVYNTMLDEINIHGKAEVWDCENFSSFLNALATVRIWKSGYYDTRGAIGWMRVDAKKEWAGLPPMMHALVFAVTEKGLFVIEPQNGQSIALADYPNKAFIQEVFLF